MAVAVSVFESHPVVQGDLSLGLTESFLEGFARSGDV